MSDLVAIVVGIGLAVLAWYDHHTRTFPLRVLAYGTLGGWVFHGLTAGWSGLFHALIAWALGCGVLWGFAKLGGLGYGDVLLMGALAGVLGSWLSTLYLAIAVSLCGGVIAAGVWIYRRIRGGHRAFPFGWAFLGGWWFFWILQWGGALHV